MASGRMVRIEVKSLRQSRPGLATCRSSPPLAPAACCRRGVPDSSPAGVSVEADTTNGRPVSALISSVLALDGGAIEPEPDRIAGQQIGRDGAEHGVDRRPARQDQPALEYLAACPRSASSAPALVLLTGAGPVPGDEAVAAAVALRFPSPALAQLPQPRPPARARSSPECCRPGAEGCRSDPASADRAAPPSCSSTRAGN